MLEAVVQSPTTQYSSSSPSIVAVVVFVDTDDGVSVEKSVTVFVVTAYINQRSSLSRSKRTSIGTGLDQIGPRGGNDKKRPG